MSSSSTATKIGAAVAGTAAVLTGSVWIGALVGVSYAVARGYFKEPVSKT